MDKDDFKRYSLLVGDGSGCLFQPMSNSYTYILTAKHLFLETKENEQGQEYKVQLPNGTDIEIKKFIQTQNGWDEEQIPFTLIEGENYFPHNDENTDIAILKIEPAIEGYSNICINEYTKVERELILCGCPHNFRENNVGERYSDFIIERIVASGNRSVIAQVNPVLNQNNVEGFSGGGVLSLDGNHLLISGIQSKMANGTNYQAGQIAFVPIKFFNEIVDYKKHKGKLSKLFPPYLKEFDFLLEECFSLEVDEIDESRIEDARTILRNKANEITQSDITPIGIKELFKERLLINNHETSCLSYKKVWISWLEFLVILNIIKGELVNKQELSEIFNSYRLKYANINDWTSIFRTDLLNSDYIGLKENSTVIVNTKGVPKTSRNLYIPKGNMIAKIGRVPDRRGFRTDKGIDPHAAFNFVHLDFFKTKCIVEKLDEYENLNEIEIIEKFKSEYNELFN